MKVPKCVRTWGSSWHRSAGHSVLHAVILCRPGLLKGRVILRCNPEIGYEIFEVFCVSVPNVLEEMLALISFKTVDALSRANVHVVVIAVNAEVQIVVHTSGTTVEYAGQWLVGESI